METRFQTSFIPKKTAAPLGGLSTPVQKRTGISIYMTLAVLLFIASLGSIGGLYAWKAKLLADREEYKKQLNTKEKQFKPAQIEELKHQNVKIDLAEGLINKHIATSAIFSILSQITIEHVQFLNMDLTVGEKPGDGVKISLRGKGTELKALAWQSDVLASLEQFNLRKVVTNPTISDPSQDPKGNNVSFSFSANIDPNSLLYTKKFAAVENAPATSTDSTP
jgi:hypothetical protein